MKSRLEKLRRSIAGKGLDIFLISQAENRRYLSGFTGSAGFLLISQKEAILATDFRYTEQAQNQAKDFRIFRIEGELPKWLPGLISSLGASQIGFEANSLSFSLFRQLINIVPEERFIPTEGLVESLRAIKDDQEMSLIVKAVELSDAAFDEVAPLLLSGMTENEVAWKLEKSMREKGSEPLPFEIIVASGPNAALAHHKPSDRQIRQGEPVVIDMGARHGGYSSDLTRTICLGKRDHVFDTIYQLVLRAQLTAFAAIEDGVNGEQADRIARNVIEKGGYGDCFGHGLGHGTGLAAHEPPRLGKGSSDILVNGMVFTIEPGVYISGWGGVRIEDMAVMENGRARVLSRAQKIGLPGENKLIR